MYRGIVVTMQVDDSRCDDQSGRIQHLPGIAALEMADLGNLTILEAGVCLIRRQPCPIENRPTLDHFIEFCHGFLRVLTSRSSISDGLGSSHKPPHLQLGSQTGTEVLYRRLAMLFKKYN